MRRNEQKRSNKFNSGFSLIELLIAMTILAVVGLLASNILFTTLKSTVKAELTKEVRQNGIYALSIVENHIRNAKRVISNSSGTTCGPNMSKIRLANQDGTQTEFSRETNEGVNKVKKEDFQSDGTPISSLYLTSNTVTLSNASPLRFVCAGDPERVDVFFTITQKGTPARPEETISIPFQTTVYRRSFD